MNAVPDEAAVLADTRHWLEAAVIGLNLCPFAKAPYVKGRVRIEVSRARHLDAFLEDLDRELQYLASVAAEEVETTLLVHPTLFPDFLLFNDMLELADAAVADNGLEGVLQIAPFHPDFQFADTGADDIGNYTNRSPYPTLHLIREDSIAKAAEAFPDAAEIFERNIALLEEMGREGWDSLGVARACPHKREPS